MSKGMWTTKQWRQRLICLLGLAPVGFAAQAELIGIEGNLETPLIFLNNQGQTQYVADSDDFQVVGVPQLMLRRDNSILQVGDSSHEGSARVEVSVIVDQTGQLVAGSRSDELRFYGAVDLDGDGSIDADGLLLQARATGFGFRDIGLSDKFDLVFEVTGGPLASLYTGQRLAMEYVSEGSSFANNFNVDFSGQAKGNIGGYPAAPVPEIAICTLVSITGDAPFFDADGISGDRCDSYLADIPSGIVGQTDATYQLVVTNTGNETLLNARINDPTLGLVDVPVPGGPMAPGDVRVIDVDDSGYSALFYGDRCRDTTGLQNNIATVEAVGEGSGISVSDDDPANVTCVTEPAVSLQKQISLDGVTFVDADTAEAGPTTTLGSDAEYRLVVENTGTEPLENLVINDPQLDLVDIAVSGTLLPGESRMLTRLDPGLSQLLKHNRCDAIGDKLNIASVSARGRFSGHTVVDDNPAFVNCQDPQIDIIKQVRLSAGDAYVDADMADEGPVGVIGDGAQYRLVVRNIGSEPLENVQISDPALGASVTLLSLDVGQQQVIDSGDIGMEALEMPLRCDTVGDKLNLVSVNAVGQHSGEAVSDEDPAYVRCLAVPSVVLKKQVSLTGDAPYFDADSPAMAAAGALGANASYRLVIENTGEEALTDLLVSDPELGLFDVTVPGGPLGAGEFRTLTRATLGQDGGTDFEALFAQGRCQSPGLLENVAMVAGRGELTGEAVAANDPAWVRCEDPQIKIIKQVSLTGGAPFRDADNALDSDVPVGSLGADAVYRLIVSNIGSEPLINVAITDASLNLVDVPVGDLVVGEVRTIDQASPGFAPLHHANRCNSIGDKLNTVSVAANGEQSGAAVSAIDPAWVRCIAGPAVELRKLVSLDGVNFAEADTEAEALQGEVGMAATYRLVVRNTGDEVLSNAVINDPALGLDAVAVPGGPLLPGQERVINRTSPGYQALHVANRCNDVGNKLNVATVQAIGQLTGQQVNDDDPANVNCVQPAVCTLDVDQRCAPVAMPSDELLCQAAIKATTLRYTGPTLLGATVSFSGKKGGGVQYDNVDLISGVTVLTQQGQNGYTIDASADGGDQLGSKTEIRINGELEIIHTSCSAVYVANQPAPLDGNTPNPANSDKGDPSPNWFVVNFEDKEDRVVQGEVEPLPGMEACTVAAGEQVRYDYRISNTGETGISLTSVYDNKLAEILDPRPQYLAPGAELTLSRLVSINDTTRSAVSAAAHVDGDPAASCGASDSVEVTVRQPKDPVSCKDIKDLTQLSMVWDGANGVNITTDLGQVFTNVNRGNKITFDVDRGDAILYLSGAVNGTSSFHLSCSDPDMNGNEDCGKRQGNGKDGHKHKKDKHKSQGTINDWLLAGMAGERGAFNCGLPNSGPVEPGWDDDDDDGHGGGDDDDDGHGGGDDDDDGHGGGDDDDDGHGGDDDDDGHGGDDDDDGHGGDDDDDGHGGGDDDDDGHSGGDDDDDGHGGDDDDDGHGGGDDDDDGHGGDDDDDGNNGDIVADRHLKVSDRKIKWKLSNHGGRDRYITRVEVDWPAAHKKLKKLKLEGDFVKKVDDYHPATVVPDEAAFERDSKKRKLKKGKSKYLEIEFDKKIKHNHQGQYKIKVHFDNGQVLSFGY